MSRFAFSYIEGVFSAVTGGLSIESAFDALTIHDQVHQLGHNALSAALQRDITTAAVLGGLTVALVTGAIVNAIHEVGD